MLSGPLGSISFDGLIAVVGILVALIAIYLICGHSYQNRGRR